MGVSCLFGSCLGYCAAVLSTTAFASRVVGGFSGFCAAALRRTCLASPGDLLLGTIAFASCVGRRFSGFGSFRVAALRRACRAPLGAALLSSLTFALRVGCHFGGFGGFRATALRRDRLTSLGAAPPSSLRLTPRCSAPASLGAALLSRTAFAPRRLPLRRLRRLSGLRALFRARLASLGAALLSPIAFTLRVGCRFGGFGGFRCAATVSSRLAPHRSARFA